MATSKLVQESLAAGFSWDEIKGQAASEYKRALAAGFTQEEVDKGIFDRYGMKFSYDPNNEDDLVLLEDIAASPPPQEAEKQLVDAEVAAIVEREMLATAKKNADQDLSRRYPFESNYTPEQLARIEEERKNLPMFRRYSDTELANPSLYSLRDSFIVRASERGELSWRDRSYQDDLVKQGLIKLPEEKVEKPQAVIRAATQQEIDSARSAPTMREAESLGDYLSYGFRHSTTSLFFAAPPKDVFLPDNPPFAMQAASALAQGVGDLPTTVAGGVMGAAATVETGPGMIGGAFAGAMGLNEGVRSSLMLGYQRGSIDSVEEFMYRIGQVGLATGKGIAMGYATGYTGGMAQASSRFVAPGLTGAIGNTLRASAQPAVEVATMTGAHALSEGRMPTMEDFAMNGIMVGGMRLGGFYTSKLAYAFQKTGTTPQSLIQFAKQNPAVKEDLMSGNMALPKEAGGNFQPLYLIKRNEPLNSVKKASSTEVTETSSEATSRPLSALPDSALVMAAEYASIDPVSVPLSRFTPAEQALLKKAGLVRKEKTEGAPEAPVREYDAVDLGALFKERDARLADIKAAREKTAQAEKDAHEPGTWYHLSQNMAAKITEGVNKKNGVTAADAPEAYAVQAVAIPAETNLLWIKSRSDPNKVRLFKQYMKELDPEAKFGDQAAVFRDATTAFENPTPAFVEFLTSGRGRMGPKENIPVEGVQGLRIGDRVMIFDQKNVLSGEVLNTINKPMQIAAADIQKSVSVNEANKTAKSQVMYDTYQAAVNRMQPINKDAQTGWQTVPYLSTRLLMGVDGLVKHWLLDGRTAFVQPSIFREVGFERPVNGKSLKDIFEMGASRVKFQLDPEVSSAIESVGVRIKEASAESNKAMLDVLESMRRDGEIAPEAYEKAKAQLIESTEALTNRKDPLNLFRTYVIAKHAQELFARGINVGLDRASIQAIVNNQALRERFEPAAKELYAYQRALLEYRYRAGRMSKKTYDKIVLQYPEYIPLQRVIEDGYGVSSTGTFGIKGSSRNIIDPFESIIRQTQFILREAERNSVLQLVAKEFGEPTTSRDSKTASVGTLADFRAIEAEGRGAGSQRTISYRVAGKEKKVSVPADIWRTAQYLDPVSANAFNGLVKAASSVAGVLRAGAILHPNFGARNFFRDQFSAYINSDSGYRPFYDFGKGLAAIYSHKTGKSLFPEAQKYYSEWLRHGGSNANLVSLDRTFTQDMIRTLLRTNNVQNSIPLTIRALDGLTHYMNPLNWGRKGYRALQTLSELSEEGTRIGEYIRAREQGINPMEAAYRSREVTMDFARMGANMKALNAMNVFLNAKIQGADRSIRQLRAHPLRTTNRIIAGIVLPSMLLAMAQQDIIHNSPDSQMAQALQEIPNWQKNTFWIVPSPVGIFRIPIPHEYGVPFANPTRSFIEYMYQNDPDKNFLQKLYDEDYFGTVGEQYFLDWNTIVSSMTPSAIQPISEVIANYSLFTGTPIIPPVMESQLPESRYNRNTTELAKSLSRMLSGINPLLDSNITQRLISPPAIDYLVAGYGGSLGRDLWSLLDSMAQKWGVVDKVNAPAKSLEDLPLISAFMVKYPNAGSKSLNDFFDKVERYEQTLASIKALMEEGTATSVQRAEYLLMNAEYGRFTSLRGALADMSGAIRTIHFAPSPETDPQAGISPEDKRRMIDSIYLDMITMAKGGLDVIQAVEQTNRAMREEQ